MGGLPKDFMKTPYEEKLPNCKKVAITSIPMLLWIESIIEWLRDK